jgi:hypothetical protein
MFSLWIQSADFESRQWAVTSQSDAVAAFESHDWAAELRHRETLAASGEEWCPPGLGLEGEGGRILHVCPQDAVLADVHYHHPSWHRVLGLFPVARDVISTLEALPLSEVPPLIVRFCDGHHEWLERRFATAQSPRR